MPCCMYCQYDLEGLPDAYSCPECGVEYDPLSTVVRIQCRAWQYRQILGAVVVLLLLGFAARRSGFRQDDLHVVGLIALVVAISLWRIARSYSSDGIVVISRSGVDFRRSGLKPVIIPWATFGAASVTPIRKMLVIRDRQPRRIFKCSANKLGGAASARKLAAEINAGRDRYQA